MFTLSLHGQNNFPFRKEPSDLDVELPDGCQDDAYLAALDEALCELIKRHVGGGPDLIFYLAGADPYQGDRLGRLGLTAQGLQERDRRVFAFAAERGIPVAVSMAGGYGLEIEETVSIQVQTVREAVTAWADWKPRGGVSIAFGETVDSQGDDTP